MIKPFNKSVSLDERERVPFNNIPDRDSFAQHDTSRSGNTSMTAAPGMMGHPLVEFEQEGTQRFNSFGDIVECIAATLRASRSQHLSEEKFSPRLFNSADGVCRIREKLQFSRHRLENLRLAVAQTDISCN